MSEKKCIKDSGSMREWEGGAHRDNGAGKGRMDYIPLKVLAAVSGEVGEEDISRIILKENIEALVCKADLIRSGLATADSIVYELKNFVVLTGLDENNSTNEVSDVNELTMFSYGVLQVAKYYQDGAEKYGADNWRKGIPTYVFIDSALRHLFKAQAGMRDEYHLRAACWNLFCYIWTAKNLPEMDEFSPSK